MVFENKSADQLCGLPNYQNQSFILLINVQMPKFFKIYEQDNFHGKLSRHMSIKIITAKPDHQQWIGSNMPR